MLRVPALHPLLQLEIVPSEGAFLVFSTTSHLITNPLYIDILQSVDGQHTTDEIARKVSDKYALPAIYYAIQVLEKKNYLIEQQKAVPPAELAFWLDMGADLPSLLAKQTHTVNLIVVPELDPWIREAMLTHLTEAAIQVDEQSPFSVVLTDNYLNPALAQINREAQTPWLLIKPVGKEIYIGPLFKPGEQGCWECLAYYSRNQHTVAHHIQVMQHSDRVVYAPEGAVASSIQLALHLAVLEIARWLHTGQGLSQEVRSFDLQTLTTERHQVNQRPNCPVCGRPAHPTFPTPIELHTRPKYITTDGGYRQQVPENFLQQYERLISPITGLCVFPKPDPLSTELNIFWTSQNLSRASHNLNQMRRGLRSNSGGKGASLAQGRASAIGESLERYSGLWQGNEYTRTASYQDLGENALHPQTHLLFSPSQYANRAESAGHYDFVPLPFDENAAVAWTPLWSLTHQTFKYMLTASCYYLQDKRAVAGGEYAIADSNGCAAGTSLEEAILQGFFELVERDCVAMWWYNRVQRPGLDLATCDHPFIRRMEAFYAQHDRRLWALDLTNDLGIPCFAAISARSDPAHEEIFVGFGCHFDPQIALIRAIGEVNQTYISFYQFPVEEWETSGEHALMRWIKTSTLQNAPYLLPLAEATQRISLPRRLTDDLSTDVRLCQSIIEAHGLEMLVLDQTRPEIDLSVVRVVVPGLRHFWRRLAPGRLYDIPLQLGWLSAPIPEEALNPITMFI